MQKDGIYISTSGTKFYYKNGLYHREDGPAIEYKNGSYMWYNNGNLHKEDGPAAKFGKTYVWYWCNKKIPVYSQEEFTRYLKLKIFI